ncbi:MAG: class I SAM-dependent methyltransferase [Candidatus Nanohaloarchaea archaeon]
MTEGRPGLREAVYENLDDLGLKLYELSGSLRAGELEATTETEEDYYRDPSVVEGYADDRRGSAAANLINWREREWNRKMFKRDGYDTPETYQEVLEELGFETGAEEEPLEGVEVLDVGGGDGWLSDYLEDLGADVVYIDRSPGMAREAREDERVSAHDYLQADATALPFEDGSFDYAVSNRVAHVIPDEDFQEYLSEMGRVSTEGAVFDTFRGPSVRKMFNDLMPMWSTLRTDEEMKEEIREADSVRLEGEDHAFTVPYVFYRTTDNWPMAAALSGFNAAANAAGDLLSSTENGWRTVSVWYLEPAETGQPT